MLRQARISRPGTISTFVVMVSLLVAAGCGHPAVKEVGATPPAARADRPYLFYLHGKIVEDQGAQAVSERFGPYRYNDIVAAFENRGFEVMSEVRPRGTDPREYAGKVADQIRALRRRGVPASRITVVGASKGAGIAALVSHLLPDEDLGYVLLAICSPYTLEHWRTEGICVHGRVLSIYDQSDEIAGSCRDLFERCRGAGLARHDEIELHVGGGHGILYRPLDEWLEPTVAWARGGSGSSPPTPDPGRR